MSREILRLENIEKYYEETGKKLHILRDLNLSIHEGEFVAILGRSGSGKTSLLNVLGLLDKAEAGEVYFEGKALSGLSEKAKNMLRNQFLGFVFQFHYLLAEFTALENVMLPAMLAKKKPEAEIRKKAIELLNFLELGERLEHKPKQLSGGEKQRVAIARALINDPKLLLADEPTGNLDDESSESIFTIFKDLREKYGQSIVVVTHSQELANLSTRSYYLKKGELKEIEKNKKGLEKR